jgi:hypothetical protein
MSLMTARSIPHALAPLVELMELERPHVVTRAQLTDWARHVGVLWPADVVIRRLREHGWLLDLATKGVWELAPASRAGAYGAGDPLVELRAVLARDPEAPYVVAAESAAFLLALSGRRPESEVIGAPPGARIPKALKGFRPVRWLPALPPVSLDGLPLWSTATLLAFMATRPAGYRDWPNVGEWIGRAVAAVTTDDLVQELQGRSRGAWARAAYLLDRGGVRRGAATLMERAPGGSGPYYLGDRARPGRHSRAYDVIDSTGLAVGAAR